MGQDRHSRHSMRPMQVIPAGSAIIAVTFGLARYAYGLFLPAIRADFRLRTEAVGVIASGQAAAYLLATVVASVIAARVGPRLPVVVGGLSATAGMLLIATAHTVCLLAAGVVVAGASAGWAYPPLSDAVARLVRTDGQSQAVSAISAGTSYGVIVAGPIALWAGPHWRLAWLAFAALAVVATLWNARLLPTGPHGGSRKVLPRLRWSWFVCPRSRPLLLCAGAIGLASSVYWTFAVDLISRGASSPALGRIFFVAVGCAGLAGALAGALVRRVGLRRALRWTLIGLAAAIALLPLARSSGAAVLGSAVLFGGLYILVTGLLGVWTMNVFYRRPSAGLGATLSLLAAGQLVGPALMGLLADQVGLAVPFYLAGGLIAALALVSPRVDIWSAVPGPPG